MISPTELKSFVLGAILSAIIVSYSGSQNIDLNDNALNLNSSTTTTYEEGPVSQQPSSDAPRLLSTNNTSTTVTCTTTKFAVANSEKSTSFFSSGKFVLTENDLNIVKMIQYVCAFIIFTFFFIFLILLYGAMKKRKKTLWTGTKTKIRSLMKIGNFGGKGSDPESEHEDNLAEDLPWYKSLNLDTTATARAHFSGKSGLDPAQHFIELKDLYSNRRSIGSSHVFKKMSEKTDAAKTLIKSKTGLDSSSPKAFTRSGTADLFGSIARQTSKGEDDKETPKDSKGKAMMRKGSMASFSIGGFKDGAGSKDKSPTDNSKSKNKKSKIAEVIRKNNKANKNVPESESTAFSSPLELRRLASILMPAIHRERFKDLKFFRFMRFKLWGKEPTKEINRYVRGPPYNPLSMWMQDWRLTTYGFREVPKNDEENRENDEFNKKPFDPNDLHHVTNAALQHQGEFESFEKFGYCTAKAHKIQTKYEEAELAKIQGIEAKAEWKVNNEKSGKHLNKLPYYVYEVKKGCWPIAASRTHITCVGEAKVWELVVDYMRFNYMRYQQHSYKGLVYCDFRNYRQHVQLIKSTLKIHFKMGNS